MNDATETIVDAVETAADHVGPRAFIAGLITGGVVYTTYRINRRFADRRQAKKLIKNEAPVETDTK